MLITLNNIKGNTHIINKIVFDRTVDGFAGLRNALVNSLRFSPEIANHFNIANITLSTDDARTLQVWDLIKSRWDFREYKCVEAAKQSIEGIPLNKDYISFIKKVDKNPYLGVFDYYAVSGAVIDLPLSSHQRSELVKFIIECIER